ncbi:complement factor B-like [Salarias fasciatus]|uniref:complement factor B-like n=1 Tax=Salarias fasciatus TaxID=181472 RepID=UPI0011765F0B|nr:complement factor B-like [Salarias fasciatus]
MLIYHCPEGYYPYPALVRLCQNSNKWKPAPKRFLQQRCRLVECPDPNVLEHGGVWPAQEKYFVGNETMYECYSGHTMRGSSRRVCLSNGKWSGQTPICSRDSNMCADPGIPPGATRTGNLFDFQDTVKYHCKDNLILVGSKTRVCQENGQWTGKEPACYYKHTYDTPLEVSQAFGSAITETLTTLESLGPTILPSAASPFTSPPSVTPSAPPLEDDNEPVNVTITVQTTANNVGNGQPWLRPSDRLDDQDSMDNRSRAEGRNHRRIRTTRNHHWDGTPGHREKRRRSEQGGQDQRSKHPLSGSSYLNTDGTRATRTPTSTREIPVRGDEEELELADDRAPGFSSASPANLGWESSRATAPSATTPRSTEDAPASPGTVTASSYSGKTSQEVRSDCTEDGVEIAGGHYTLTKQLKVDSMLIYHCPEGYYPYPALVRLCQNSSKWKPAPKRFLQQRCRLVECPDPNVLEYGSVWPPQEKYFVGNETTYECYSGHTMRGSSRRVCLSNGKWSGQTPICSRDTAGICADPGIPPGATRTGNIFDFQDTVKYHCKDNLILVGSKTRVCQENGQWTGKEPACYYKHTYDTPLEVSQAFGSAITETLTTLESLDDTQEGRKIRLTKNGTLNIYIAVDISESIEKDQYEKARDAVTKLIRKISSYSVTPNYEIVFFSSEVYEIVNILDFFGGGVTLSTVEKKLKDFTIDDKNTGTDLTQVFNKFLEKMAFLKIQLGEDVFREHRHVFLIFTDGGYNMGGSPAPSVARIKNTVYMNHTAQSQNLNREDHLDIYIFAIGAQIFDDDLQPLVVGKEGKHYFRMKDIKNLQETFDEIIDEEEVKGLCGLHRSYDEESPRRRYPWYALIVVLNEGSPRKCFGSLVSRRFVLTAAHCFKFGDEPKHVTVEIEDGQVKQVADFKLHPNYDVDAKAALGVQEFYDYDVALIQLEDDVQISTSVRPICIPCTQETSDALKLVGASTCRQQELQISDCSSNSLMQRKECIKHALEAQGIDTDNPEEAVTENFLCTGGISHRREHIACKGDSGGAVFKNYQNRTIQVAVVSWGTKNLCTDLGGKFESDKTSRDFHINLFRVVPFLRSILGNDTQDVYAPLLFLNE